MRCAHLILAVCRLRPVSSHAFSGVGTGGGAQSVTDSRASTRAGHMVPIATSVSLEKRGLMPYLAASVT